VGRVTIEEFNSRWDSWCGGDCCGEHQLYCGGGQVGQVTIELWHLDYYAL